jgi:SAM-dependent methyltransferase
MEQRAREMADYTEDPLWWAWSDSRLVMTLDRAGCSLLRRLPGESGRDRLTPMWRALVHYGGRVECPVCGGRFRHFAHRWNDRDVICWSCGSEERHRALWLFLTGARPELLAGARGLLHFAPEPALQARLRTRPGLRYVSCDIEPAVGSLEIDITGIALESESFDAILCAHVLEHVPDDAKAMRELHRVLAPGGWCVVMVPIGPGLETTDEDPSVTDPAERRSRFWQEDHVRLYGPDVVDRLDAAGFAVERIRPTDIASANEVERLRLGGLGSDILLCRKTN